MIKLTREFYIPQNAKKVNTQVQGVEVYEYITEVNKQIAAVCFVGKTVKPTWKFWFNSEEQKQARIQKTIEKFKADKIAKAQRATQRKQQQAEASTQVNIGDIFVESHHCEYTIIEFWQVVSKHCTKVELMPIDKRLVDTDTSGRNEEYMPDIGIFTSNKVKTMTISAKHGDTIYLNTSGNWHTVSSWSGKPVYQTNAYWR